MLSSETLRIVWLQVLRFQGWRVGKKEMRLVNDTILARCFAYWFNIKLANHSPEMQGLSRVRYVHADVIVKRRRVGL